ncbi:hypothetical protein ACKKBG_A24935 [Auxenochlorella protothecoides x Auxenochlorella symbiontica]
MTSNLVQEGRQPPCEATATSLPQVFPGRTYLQAAPVQHLRVVELLPGSQILVGNTLVVVPPLPYSHAPPPTSGVPAPPRPWTQSMNPSRPMVAPHRDVASFLQTAEHLASAQRAMPIVYNPQPWQFLSRTSPPQIISKGPPPPPPQSVGPRVEPQTPNKQHDVHNYHAPGGSTRSSMSDASAGWADSFREAHFSNSMLSHGFGDFYSDADLFVALEDPLPPGKRPRCAQPADLLC